ncbi:MAG: prolyl aminopeptidase [Alphaproteobacteria bacterium]|nr:prolyl aminopeptidase [Alphaproteobacteria bacterium]
MNTPLIPLFPDINPYASGYIDVSHGHHLYWEQCGNPEGTPILFLHGGPGGGTSPHHRRLFDPNFYRIILMDQRGSGKSTPHASINHNTRQDLVADINVLRTHLNIDRWHVFGGSWGSTLALSYAIAYPHTCRSLILRGIFLMEQDEIDWFLYGLRHVYPDEWGAFTSDIPVTEQHDLLSAFQSRLNHPDPRIALESAIKWAQYESHCANLIKKEHPIITENDKAFALAISRIECHYFINEVIKPENSLLKSIDKIRHIPGTIIHGRYDMICPLQAGYKLHRAWPEAQFIIVPDAGHSAFDPPIRSELIKATEHAKTY